MPKITDKSLSISAFCAAEGVSLSTYFKMRRDGHGPDEVRVPGSKIIRIAPEARLAWHQKMQQRDRQQTADLARLRRRRQGRTAFAAE